MFIAAATPLIFTDVMSEFYEMPKIAFLVASTVILLLAWSISWILQGKVIITKTPLDIPLLLLLIVIIVSTYFSSSQYVSIYGNFPRIHGSAVSWISYILLYFIAASNLKTQSQVRNIFYALLGSTTLVAIISLASYFGAYLPLNFSKFAAFTPTGSVFSTTALVILLLPVTILSTIYSRVKGSASPSILPFPVPVILTTLFLVIIVLMGNLLTIATAVIVIGLSLFISNNNQITKNLPLLLIPAIIAGVFFLGGYVKNDRNILYKRQTEFAKFREIQLPLNFSWKVAASAFRDEPFKGTGPSTFIFNFTNYKPAEINLTKINGVELWNLRFDTAFNEYLQALGTTGALGFLSLAFFSVLVVIVAWNGLGKKEHTQTLSSTFIPSLSVSAIASILLLTIHTTTPVAIVASLFILALLMTTHKIITGKVEELTLGIRAQRSSGTGTDANLILAVILFIPILFLSIYISVQIFQAVRADIHHRKAFTIPVNNVEGIYNNLRQALENNNKIDTYHMDFSQVNFAIANSIAASKAPTESSPSGSLTEADKQQIQLLLSQSVTNARIATALSPRSAQNWEVLAAIYRQIAGVAENALTFSLDAYGRSIQQDPLNPQLRLNVGGVYFSVKNYDLAIRFFTDAVNLKPDFANGYYNLAIALKEKGALKEAAAAIQQVIRLVDPKSQDYQTATKLLSELNEAIKQSETSGEQAQTTPQVPPAAEEKSALEKKELPNVLELEKPEQISTPEAIKASPSPRP